ncbi:hypothetical protein BD289DRAFT_261039 [Coniella lustricola]|uniref:Uncharacterized protein n=1 Tax=Coniella lustricola TaxID=2025994 RepID=A0A2T3A7T5_9PEZI|nr:hypothetical protein BD289DRAFT_261039 [Coniella lustricola]
MSCHASVMILADIASWPSPARWELVHPGVPMPAQSTLISTQKKRGTYYMAVLGSPVQCESPGWVAVLPLHTLYRQRGGGAAASRGQGPSLLARLPSVRLSTRRLARFLQRHPLVASCFVCGSARRAVCSVSTRPKEPWPRASNSQPTTSANRPYQPRRLLGTGFWVLGTVSSARRWTSDLPYCINRVARLVLGRGPALRTWLLLFISTRPLCPLHPGRPALVG